MASDPSLDLLLEHLRRTRGFDFSGYKRTTLQRRIARRMEAVHADTYQDYVDHLEVQPAEFAHLFDTILINVTSFFRDPAAWEHLSTETIPRLLEDVGDGQVRAWCAGCASGEEPYTLAMVLAEAMGDEAFSERVKIYATDVDENALNAARHAVYTEKQVEGVTPERLERHFERSDAQFAFRKDLRRSVIFGRNDLLQDAPISRIDLLLCRNTLMYFNAEAQGRILRRFHFALNPEGVLFLGKSEMLIAHTDLFRPVSLQRRIYQKVLREAVGDQLHHAVAAMEALEIDGRIGTLHERAFEATPTAQIIVDADGVLVAANQRARALFRLLAADVGRPLKDLELSYRPVELRSNLEEAYARRRSVLLTSVPMTADGEGRELEVHITPVYAGDAAVGATVAFVDVTLQQRLNTELRRSKANLEQAYEELQSTVEELETTNEELQSTNEELETTNEELQSTNEELETMNEELHSTNEELETINDELRSRTEELNEVNAFLESILSGLGAAVAVVDRNLGVRVWNSHAADLWGLRADEVEGQPLIGLDIGLPMERLKAPLRAVLRGAQRQEFELEATNRRGRKIRLRVSAMPLAVDSEAARGAIVVMEVLSEGG
jgi:two-component system CheB/CheR fusion protein